MEDELAVARRWVELYNERSDVAEFVSLLDPEVELQTPGGPRLHGHDQARDWFDREPENVQARIIPDRFIEGGDVVVGLGRTEVRWIESGEIAYEGESAALIWFRDGKIVRWQPFETHAAALDAAGLSGYDRNESRIRGCSLPRRLAGRTASGYSNSRRLSHKAAAARPRC